MNKLFLSGLLGLAFLWACNPHQATPVPSEGILHLDEFVAIGDGYVAGKTNAILNDSLNDSLGDTGWHREGQLNSFPRLLANQFSYARSLTFTQPLLSDKGSGSIILKALEAPLCPFQRPAPLFEQITADPAWASTPPPGRVDNLGLPGLSIPALSMPLAATRLKGYSLLGVSPGQSYLQAAKKREGRFFAVFLGLESLVQYALEGAQTPGLVPVQEFSRYYAELLDSLLTDSESACLIGNLPDPTQFSYFSRITPRFVNIENCEGTFKPIFITRASGEIEPASQHDRMLMDALPYLGTDYGGQGPFGLTSLNPVPADWVLDAQERLSFQQQIHRYNESIDSLVQLINHRAGTVRAAVVNLNDAFEELPGGTIELGLGLSNEFLSGGIFALDGLYLTPRGNAWLANQFISVMNRTRAWGAQIPPLDLTAFPGVRYP